jgi:hypothetical protein
MAVNLGGLEFTGKVVPSPSPFVLSSIAGFSDFFARGNQQSTTSPLFPPFYSSCVSTQFTLLKIKKILKFTFSTSFYHFIVSPSPITQAREYLSYFIYQRRKKKDLLLYPLISY